MLPQALSVLVAVVRQTSVGRKGGWSGYKEATLVQSLDKFGEVSVMLPGLVLIGPLQQALRSSVYMQLVTSSGLCSVFQRKHCDYGLTAHPITHIHIHSPSPSASAWPCSATRGWLPQWWRAALLPDKHAMSSGVSLLGL